MGGDVLRCEGLSVEVLAEGRRKPLISDISFSLARGEFLSIVGPSGTGKTTLMRALAGLAHPTSGTVEVNGTLVTAPPEGTVTVFQDYSNSLLPWRSVLANVLLGVEQALRADQARERAMNALRRVGLEHSAAQYPWQLSGGMQQRVQIARALAVQPSLLLMDEPFGALDAITKAQLQDEVLAIRQATGCSFVFITHDIEEAVYLGDRVAVLNGAPGRLELDLEIRLPQPRNQLTTRESPQFLEYRHKLFEAIRLSWAPASDPSAH